MAAVPLGGGFPAARKLENLNLADNQAGDQGTASLAGVLAQTHLTCLDLARNTVGDVGAASLANALGVQPPPPLIELRLEGNCITRAGATQLCDALATNGCMLTLDLTDNPAVTEAPGVIANITRALHRNWCRRALWGVMYAHRRLEWAKGSHRVLGATSSFARLPLELCEMVSEHLCQFEPPVAQVQTDRDGKTKPPPMPPPNSNRVLDRYAAECHGTPSVWTPMRAPSRMVQIPPPPSRRKGCIERLKTKAWTAPADAFVYIASAWVAVLLVGIAWMVPVPDMVRPLTTAATVVASDAN